MNKAEDSINRKKFLCNAGLKLEDDPVIQLRRKFKNEEPIYEELLDDAFLKDVERLEATLEWMSQKFSIIGLKSVKDISLRKIYDYYWDIHKRTPDVVPVLNFNTENDSVNLQIKPADWNKLRYIDSWSVDEAPLWRDIHNQVDYEFICIPDSNGKKLKEGLISAKNILEARITKSIDVPPNESYLWEDKVYRTWNAKEPSSLNIFLLDRSVPFLYRFVSGSVSFTVNLYENKKTDRSQDDIYVYKEFPEEDIFKVLIDRQDVLFKKDPDKLVRLLAEKLKASTADDNLLTEDQKDKFRNDPKSFQRIFDLPEEDIQILSTNTESVLSLIRDVDIEDLSRLVQATDENTRRLLLKNLDLIETMAEMDVFEVLGRLLEKADKEHLEKLVEMWDEIEQDLERRKPNPRPVALIGYIGEKVVYWWLVQKTNNIDYKGLEYLPYDISLQYGEHPYYVEVKTTIQPDKESDDSIPFYLRKSQYRFIQNNPNSDYIVIKINLKDLGLDHLYYEYKTLGQDFNSIVEHYEAEIDEKIKLYINTPNGQARLKSSRMTFKMNIPRFDQEFWED